MADKCICGHEAQGHATIEINEFPRWDIGACDYYKCSCHRFRRDFKISKTAYYPKPRPLDPACLTCNKTGVHTHLGA